MHKSKGASKELEFKAHNAASVRATISFPRELYAILDAIAKEKKVSLAWVVREASEQYVGDQWPLFNQIQGNGNEKQ